MDKKLVTLVDSFVVTINNDRWVINLYRASHFSCLWPDTLGITDYDHKKKRRNINLPSSKTSKDTIAHELMHAYLSYHNFSKTSYGVIEEKVCEVIGKKHRLICELTDKIYKRFYHGKKRQAA